MYEKHDNRQTRTSTLEIVSCTYIDSSRTADYQTTRGINDIINRDGNAEDIFAYLGERCIPGDEITLMRMANDITANPPQIGYLTMSNALQWRLQYGRVVSLQEKVKGITQIIA